MNKTKKRKNKVLVTGGAGFIGSHIAIELLKNGYDVLIGDNFSNSSPEMIDRIEKIASRRPEFQEIDFCDREATFKLFSDYPDIAFIIHLAGHKSAGESVSNPLKYYRNNLLSANNVIEAALENEVKNFIFSSSAAVYGDPDQVPVSEASPIKKPANPYGNTKKIIEEILNDVCRFQGKGKFRVISLRYFNAAGAHKSSLIGELPKGAPENLIPFITQTAAGIRDELKVFGNDYGTPDGTCIRDYIHVLDLVSAHLKALERLENEDELANFEAYNIGTGQGVSVLEAIKAFEKVSGLKLKYRIVSRRVGDLEIVYADSSLATKILNWKAEHDIEDIMEDAWAWEKFYRGIKD